MKSGNKVIIKESADCADWMKGFVATVCNVYRTRASVTVCVDPGRMYLIRIEDLEPYLK